MTEENEGYGVVTYNAPPPGQMVAVAEVRDALDAMHNLVNTVLEEGIHYGTIPGVKDKVLLKPGAEEIFKAFLCRPEFVRLPESFVGWAECSASYAYKCRAIHVVSEIVLAEGEGMCTTRETKYALRSSAPACPECGHELRKSKKAAEWYCWTKEGGCGATFALDSIDGSYGKRPATSEEWADTLNTVMKMAQKRAMVACALTLGAVSSIFTQDMDDGVIEAEPVTRRAAPTPAPTGRPPTHPPAARSPLVSALQREQMLAAMKAAELSIADVALILGCEQTRVPEAIATWIFAEKGRTVAACLGYVTTRLQAATATPEGQEPLPLEEE